MLEGLQIVGELVGVYKPEPREGDDREPFWNVRVEVQTYDGSRRMRLAFAGSRQDGQPSQVRTALLEAFGREALSDEKEHVSTGVRVAVACEVKPTKSGKDVWYRALRAEVVADPTKANGATPRPVAAKTA